MGGGWLVPWQSSLPRGCPDGVSSRRTHSVQSPSPQSLGSRTTLHHVRSNHSEAVYTQHNKQFNPQNQNLFSRYYIISHLWSNVSISVMWDQTIAKQSTLNTTNDSIHKNTIYLVDITPSHIMVKCLHLRHVRSNHSEAVYTQHIKQFNPQNHNLFSRYYTISHLWSNVSISVMWDQTIAKQSTLNTTNDSIHKNTIYLVDITPSHIMVEMSPSPSCEIQP